MVKKVRAIGIRFISIIGHNGLETKKCLKGKKREREREQIVTALMPCKMIKMEREYENNLIVSSFRII